MHRVPDEIGQKAGGVVVERLRLGNHHTARLPLVPSGLRGQGRSRGAVHHLPPALGVVPGIHHHQLTADPLHQGNGQRPAHGGVEAGHDIALLHLVGIGAGPIVVLPCGVVGGIDLGPHLLQLLKEISAVAVPDGVRPPTLEQFQGFGHHIHVGGDGDPAKFLLFFAH